MFNARVMISLKSLVSLSFDDWYKVDKRKARVLKKQAEKGKSWARSILPRYAHMLETPAIRERTTQKLLNLVDYFLVNDAKYHGSQSEPGEPRRHGPFLVGKPLLNENLRVVLNRSDTFVVGKTRPVFQLVHNTRGNTGTKVALEYHTADVDALAKLEVLSSWMFFLEYLHNRSTRSLTHDDAGNFMPVVETLRYRFIQTSEFLQIKTARNPGESALMKHLLHISRKSARFLYLRYYEELRPPGDWMQMRDNGAHPRFKDFSVQKTYDLCEGFIRDWEDHQLANPKNSERFRSYNGRLKLIINREDFKIIRGGNRASHETHAERLRRVFGEELQRGWNDVRFPRYYEQLLKMKNAMEAARNPTEITLPANAADAFLPMWFNTAATNTDQRGGRVRLHHLWCDTLYMLVAKRKRLTGESLAEGAEDDEKHDKAVDNDGADAFNGDKSLFSQFIANSGRAQVAPRDDKILRLNMLLAPADSNALRFVFCKNCKRYQYDDKPLNALYDDFRDKEDYISGDAMKAVNQSFDEDRPEPSALVTLEAIHDFTKLQQAQWTPRLAYRFTTPQQIEMTTERIKELQRVLEYDATSDDYGPKLTLTPLEPEVVHQTAAALVLSYGYYGIEGVL